MPWRTGLGFWTGYAGNESFLRSKFGLLAGYPYLLLTLVGLDTTVCKLCEKVCVSRWFENPQPEYDVAAKACCNDYTDTGPSKRVHWQSNIQSINRSTSNYRCEDMAQLNIEDGWASLLIIRIHLQVAEESKIVKIPAAPHDTGRMDHWEVHHGSCHSILIMGPVDVESAYSYSALRYHCIKWCIQAYGRHYASFRRDDDSMEGRLNLCDQVCTPEADQISGYITPMGGMLHSLAHILNFLRKLPLFMKWNKEKNVNSEDETSDSTQYHKAFLNEFEDENCAKYIWLTVIQSDRIPSNNPFPLQSLL